MLKYNNRFLFILLVLMMGVILTANTACAAGIDIPKETVAVLIIKEDGKVLVYDANGKAGRDCTFPVSKKAKEDSECRSLRDSTMYKKFDTIESFLIGGSCYMTIIIAGNPVEIPLPPAYCP